MRHLLTDIRSRDRLSRAIVAPLAAAMVFSILAPSAKAASPFTTTPTVMSFVAVEGGSNPPMQSLTISTPGSKGIPWLAVSSASWIQVLPLTGTTPSSVLVLANVAGMGAGTYTGAIVFTSKQTGTNQKVVTILVTVAPQTPSSQ